MHFGYTRPFSFRIEPRPAIAISRVRHGVTEIKLSDGRLVRATLHIKSIKIDPNHSDRVDLSCNVIAEIMPVPEMPIHDVHETLQ